MPQSPSQRVADELRTAIFRAKSNQETVAERSGLSRSAVSRRLNGDVEMTLSELEAIAGAVDLEVSIQLSTVMATSGDAA